MDYSTAIRVAICALIIIGCIPMILGKVKRNAWYGFRTAKTVASDEFWYPANRFAGCAIAAGAVVSAVAVTALEVTQPFVTLSPHLRAAALLVPLLLAVAASLLYSWRL